MFKPRALYHVLILVLGFASAAMAVDPPGEAVPLEQANLDTSKLRVHFIDVGPGLAMLIQTPGDKVQVFVDGGKRGFEGLLKYVEHFMPSDAGFDIGIVTHADSDHYRGMEKIFGEYAVGQFWYTGYENPKIPDMWDTFLGVVEEEGCEQYVPIKDFVVLGQVEAIDNRGTSSKSDDISVTYLNIDDNPAEVDSFSGRRFKESERRNNASLVFKLTYKDISFLITGDINGRHKGHTAAGTDNEMDSEELELWTRHNLMDKCNLKSTVLQAPHHGSNGSCSLPFLKAVDPEWVVIPAGHEFNHPHPSTLRRISKADVDPTHVLRTDDGDSTPEKSNKKDPIGDDSYVFETDGNEITRITKVKIAD
jgi:competence protein ComEC